MNSKYLFWLLTTFLLATTPTHRSHTLTLSKISNNF